MDEPVSASTAVARDEVREDLANSCMRRTPPARSSPIPPRSNAMGEPVVLTQGKRGLISGKALDL